MTKNLDSLLTGTSQLWVTMELRQKRNPCQYMEGGNFFYGKKHECTGSQAAESLCL